MGEVTIRAAARGDLAAILALYRHLHPDDPAVETATAERVWETLTGSAFMTVVVAELERQVVASCTLAVVPNLTRGGRPYGVIENVVTHSEHRQLGLGRQVLTYALDAARKAGCYKVCLATGSQRETTLRFYEGAGFARGRKTYFEVREPDSGVPGEL
jgi:GNAT superfamily N-acetyltransferase